MDPVNYAPDSLELEVEITARGSWRKNCHARGSGWWRCGKRAELIGGTLAIRADARRHESPSPDPEDKSGHQWRLK